MTLRLSIAVTAALALLTLASCEKATESGTGLETLKSTLPSQQMNANQVANLYRQAKISGAPEFQRPMSAKAILTALESGVHGSGIYAESVFRISPINSEEREQVIALLEGILKI